MRPWSRWNDWVTLIAGAWLFISPWVLAITVEPTASWNAWIVGILMVAVSLGALASPGMLAAVWGNVVLGAWLFLSPWILGYSHLVNASWNAWIVGIVAVVSAALAVPTARAAYQGTERPT